MGKRRDDLANYLTVLEQEGFTTLIHGHLTASTPGVQEMLSRPELRDTPFLKRADSVDGPAQNQ